MKTFLSEKQTAFKSIIMLMLVMFTGLMADAQKSTTAGKQKPVIYVGNTGYGGEGEKATYLNDTKFIEPAIVVYENDNKQTQVTNRFYLSYYLTSGTADGTKGTNIVEKGETWNVDAATGTRVNTRYGDIETGHSAGVVYVHVKAVPSDRYTNMFEEAEATYRITLNKVQAEAPVRVVPEFVTDETYRNGWYAATGTTISLPKFKINYVTTDNNGKELDVDITKRFSVTATVENGSNEFATVENEHSFKNLYGATDKCAAIKANKAGTANIVFSFTPLYEGAYESIANLTIPLTIIDSKVKPKLVFPKEIDELYQRTNNNKVLRPVIYDQFGNDITLNAAYGDNNSPLRIAWGVTKKKDGMDIHVPDANNGGVFEGAWDANNTEPAPEGYLWAYCGPMMYGPDNLSTDGGTFLDGVKRNEFCTFDRNNLDGNTGTGKQADYKFNVYCQVYPKPHYDWETTPDYTKLYDTTESSYKVLSMVRSSKLVLDPDPSTFTLTKGTQITFENRFMVKAVHEAKVYDSAFQRNAGESLELRQDTYGDGKSWYTFKFKTGEAKVEGFPDEANRHITVDAKGNPAEPKDGETFEVYKSVQCWGNDKNWTLTFLKDGAVNIQYAVYPYNTVYGDCVEDVTVNKTFRIEDKVTPTITVTPDPIIIYTSDKDFPTQPNITVTDGLGNDIQTYYDLKLSDESKKTLEAAGITIDDKGDFIISGKLVNGDYSDLTFIATPKEEYKDKYNQGETTFRIIVKDLGQEQRFSWAVYDKNGNHIGTSKDNIPEKDHVHGKLVLTGAGVVNGGYTIDAIPGLTVQFGTLAKATGEGATVEDPWIAKTSEDNNKVVIYGDPVEIDRETGLPVDGTFYILTPRTNGFLTIDAKFKAGNNIVLTDAKGKEKQYIDKKATEKKPVQFRYPIFANTTYYLYNEGDADSYEPLKIHGISFEPGFITLRNDMKPIESATAYANGYAGALPTLTSSTTAVDEFVAYDIAGELNDKNESISDYAEISKEYGTVTTKSKGTSNKFNEGTKSIENHGALQLKDNHMKVYAEVKSAYKGSTIKKVPAYDLYIGDIPTYIMENGYTPNVLERISTTNYPTHIRAFFGGWENGENRPYIKNNKIGETDESKIEMLVDSWKTSKMDSVGSNQRVIDNFSFGSFGTQNATSETVNGTFTYSKDNEDQTYNVPCRGTYVQFEPNESGTIAVYIIQNGMVAYDGDPDNAKKSGINKLKLNPVFITDETGTPVELAKWTHSLEGNNTDAYTEAVIRCSYADMVADCNGVNLTDKSAETAKELLEKVGYIGSPTQAATINKGDHQQVYDIAKVLDENAVPGSKGYSVITKAYTRYSFRVKAGKSYFLFMNGSKLGNDGFAFMPDNWTPGRTPAELTTVTLDEKGTKEGSKDEFIGKEKDFAHYDKTVNVKLYHSFTAGQWTALSLPFSINESQFKKIFGDDAWAISLDEVADKATVSGEEVSNVALFTQHNYHWIVAGRPYFVRPDKDFQQVFDEEAAGGRQYIEIDSVTFEHATYSSATNGEGFIVAKNLVNKKTDFNFRANYEPTPIKAGDYFLGTKDGQSSLYRATKETKLPGYRAFISNESSNGARIGSFAFGDINEDGDRNTTGIDEVYEFYDNGMNKKLAKKKGIFSIDGVKVADSAADLDKLPAGVYIINGQTIVK
ncbi:hypothetical protein [Prevotella sp.]|uniref:hypothetical protein n=1 Tax=Prevotella sp. TaxID=59823 RepID=UPI002600CE5D|nr:hypothetical protein [Prevotella sp.]